MIPHKLKINLLALAALLLFVLCCPALADAHANMERSTPLQDAELSESPSSIRIQYTEEFDPDLSRIVLEDEAGNAIKGKLSVEKDRWLVYTIPKLSPGIYKVKWQVLSVDTHVTDGSFRFAVGVPLATTKPSDTISLDGGSGDASPSPAATAKPSASPSPSAGSSGSGNSATGGKGSGSQGSGAANGSGTGGNASGEAAGSGGSSGGSGAADGTVKGGGSSVGAGASGGKTNGGGGSSVSPSASAGTGSGGAAASDAGSGAGAAEGSASSGQGGTGSAAGGNSSVTEPGEQNGSIVSGSSEVSTGSKEVAGTSKNSDGKSASGDSAEAASGEQQAATGLDSSATSTDTPTVTDVDSSTGETADESQGHSIPGEHGSADHGADSGMEMDEDGSMVGHSGDHNAEHQSDWRTVIYTLLRIIEVLAAACMVAFLYARYVLWSRADGSAIPRLLSKRSERLLLIGAAIALGVTGFFHVWLLAEQLSAFEMGSGGTLYQKILTATMVGRAAWLRPALAALMLLLAYAPQRDERWVAPLKWLMALLLTVLYPLTGHANASPLFSAAVLSHIVHIWTAAIWFGGLVAIISATLKSSFPSAEEQGQTLHQMIKRFSQAALPIIILLAATGVILSLQRLNVWTELVDSSYGRLALLKTLLLVAVIGIGAYHRFSLMPRLTGMGKWAADNTSSAHKFVQAVRVEALLALAAFIVAGMLSSTAPPEQPAYAEPVYWHVMGDKAHMSMRIKPEEQAYQLDVWLPTGMGAPTLIDVQAKDDSGQGEVRDIPFEFNKGGPDPYGYEGFDKYTYLSKAPVPAVGDVWDMTIVITDPTGEEHRYEKRIP
ncbi:Putative copper export protein [Paenibacillus algorifonticola]|uniref:Putative copper export protein n=1 Tax=Paenibacillus algorifonticola TaxID=684063 RepID=A0A1I2HVW9_9BACL|nr:CopD family protein [Paenibacillus algorifonticola]SFF33688.1 Putative copper export protein [Paenibacillus algorifonticola]